MTTANDINANLTLPDKVNSLRTTVKSLAKVASDYDFQNVQHNGIRSSIKVFDCFLRAYEEFNINSLKVNQNLEQKLSDVSDLLMIMSEILLDNLVGHSKLTYIDHLDILMSIPEQKLISLYSIGYFWLSDEQNEAIRKMSNYVALFTGDFKVLMDSEHAFRLKAKRTQDYNIMEFKRLAATAEYSWINWIARWRYPVDQCQQVNVETHSNFELQIDGSFFKKATTNIVECQVIRFKSSPKFDGKVLYHAHGGGFAVAPPIVHQIYLRQIARACPGLTIVTPHYGLAPERKYPAALQDMTDVYLHLSDPELSKSMLGFVPEELILFGDSAGGTLHLGMCHVLDELGFAIPEKMILCYASTGGSFSHFKPSATLMIVDSMLSFGTLLNFSDGYAPGPMYNYHEDRTPFYKRSRDLFLSRIREISDHSSTDKFYNPMLGSHELFKKTRLVNIACEFDPLLDAAIVLAREWPVADLCDLIIIEGMTHGFLGSSTKEGCAATEHFIKKLQHLCEM